MLLHLDRLPFIFCFPRTAGQHKAYRQHGHQPVYLRWCGHMCVFQVESFAFQAAKQRLYLPTLAVCFNPLALFVTANHQQLLVGQTGRLKI